MYPHVPPVTSCVKSIKSFIHISLAHVSSCWTRAQEDRMPLWSLCAMRSLWRIYYQSSAAVISPPISTELLSLMPCPRMITTRPTHRTGSAEIKMDSWCRERGIDPSSVLVKQASCCQDERENGAALLTRLKSSLSTSAILPH